jgi:hypothetical protein
VKTKEKLQKITSLIKQATNFEEPTFKDKLFHFFSGSGGNRKTYRGSYNGKKAYYSIYRHFLVCEIRIGIEINKDLLDQMKRKPLAPWVPTKYEKVAFDVNGYLVYESPLKQIPAESIGISEIERLLQKFNAVAREIESAEHPDFLATFRQINRGQFIQMPKRTMGRVRNSALPPNG